ncbi:ArsO family NAD(P)H-dependent flavin-containing monooxygenase [Propionibacteriaceae bacterium Y2011]|uniref:ArsO family NAD(P)H-dependent flavin-containing monooxygenase n=1 Tax=Microlunatus sp. Y2014 TaxID=3418488 RepID=UPI003B498D25
MQSVGTLVIGGGQSGLATGWYLRRSGLVPERDFVILDAATRPGGAWARMWPTLRTFSPAEYSSLPGSRMPAWHADDDQNPDAKHVADYLSGYEERYELAVRRPVRVVQVDRSSDRVVVQTDHGDWEADHVINATGTWSRPFVPWWRGLRTFPGTQLHTVGYEGAEAFAGQHVLVVGGGNSGAQILAEVSQVAETRWVTRRRPRFLPDDVDGRELFQLASARRRSAVAEEQHPQGVAALGDVVMVPEVLAARDRGALVAHRPFDVFEGSEVVWDQGTRFHVDSVIWATGFRPALRHLRGTGLVETDGTASVEGTRSTVDPRFHFVGYGDWTGPASATLIGVGQTLRGLAEQVQAPVDRG